MYPDQAPGVHRMPENYPSNPNSNSQAPPWERDQSSPRYDEARQQRHHQHPPPQEIRESPMQPACWTYWHWMMFLGYTTMLIVMAVQYQRVGILVLLMAVVPTIVVFVVFWVLREDNVSWPLLIEMFWFGLFGAIPIAFVEAGVAYMTSDKNGWKMLAVASLNAFLIAAFCEECFKYIIISRVVRDERAEDCWHRHPHRPYGTILCGCAAALGFATIENILYCWADLAVQTAVLRAILAVPGHCAGGVIIAVGVTERIFYGKDTNAFWILLPSVLFHGFYDWFLMASAIGYLDSRETGEAVALAGLTLAMFTDILQFLYMFRRLNLLEEEGAEYEKVRDHDEYE